jgi:hypothetical protein
MTSAWRTPPFHDAQAIGQLDACELGQLVGAVDVVGSEFAAERVEGTTDVVVHVEDVEARCGVARCSGDGAHVYCRSHVAVKGATDARTAGQGRDRHRGRQWHRPGLL